MEYPDEAVYCPGIVRAAIIFIIREWVYRHSVQSTVVRWIQLVTTRAEIWTTNNRERIEVHRHMPALAPEVTQHPRLRLASYTA